MKNWMILWQFNDRIHVYDTHILIFKFYNYITSVTNEFG